jgi:hypothetical protein
MPNSPTWDSWQNLGGACGNRLAVGASTDGRLELFGVNTEGRIFHNSQQADGKWSDWQSLGDALALDPMVGRNRDGRVVLIARDSDGKLQYRVQREPAKSAIWDGWYSLSEWPGTQ